MGTLRSCTLDMLSHRRRPSLLLSTFFLAYSPSIPKNGMREVSGAPCPFSVVPNLLQDRAEPE